MIITDEALANALDDMKRQGFEIGKVYSNPYATAFKPDTETESPITKKLREAEELRNKES
jgi:hypothetical protein